MYLPLCLPFSMYVSPSMSPFLPLSVSVLFYYISPRLSS
jgi:hypothetical protein